MIWGACTWELMQFIPHCSTLIVGQLLYFPNNRPRHDHAVSLINSYLRRHVQRPHVFWRHQRSLLQAGLYFDGVHLNNYGMYKYWRSLRTIVGRELRRYRPVRQWSDDDCQLTTVVKCCGSFLTHCRVIIFVRYNYSNFVLILYITMQTSVALIAPLSRTAYYGALLFHCY